MHAIIILNFPNSLSRKPAFVNFGCYRHAYCYSSDMPLVLPITGFPRK